MTLFSVNAIDWDECPRLKKSDTAERMIWKLTDFDIESAAALWFIRTKIKELFPDNPDNYKVLYCFFDEFNFTKEEIYLFTHLLCEEDIHRMISLYFMVRIEHVFICSLKSKLFDYVSFSIDPDGDNMYVLEDLNNLGYTSEQWAEFLQLTKDQMLVEV